MIDAGGSLRAGPLRCLTAASDRDRGQTATEYLGMIVVISAVIGVVALGGLGQRLSAEIKAAICRVTGGTCTVQSVDHVPEAECEVLSHSGEISASVTVFSVDIGGKAKVTLSKGIDANGNQHWYVQQQGSVDAGVVAKFGEKAHVGDVGEGLEGDAKAMLTGGGGQKMEFPDEKAARDYITGLQHEIVKQGLADGIGGPLAGPLVKWGLDKIDSTPFNPPPAKEYFFEGGGKVAGSVEGEAGVVSGSVDGEGSALVGMKVAPQPGGGDNTTYYVKVSAEAAGKLGLFNAVEGKAGPSGEVVVGITYDKSGKPITANLEAAGEFKAEVGPSSETALIGQAGKGLAGEAYKKAVEEATKKAAKSSNGVSLGGGVKAKLGIDIDLQKGDNLNVVADGLHSLGVPVLMGSGTPGGGNGVGGMLGLVTSGADGTTTTLTTYTTTSSGGTAGVSGGEGVAFGVEGGLTFSDEKIQSGSYYMPGQGFVTWEACGK
jgi:hypothetical protein